MIYTSVKDLGALIAGKPMTFCTGAFDLYHARHAWFLSLAFLVDTDMLHVVGVDTDEKVRRRKGPGRPVYPWKDRSEIVACHHGVNCVFPLDADDATEAVDILRPAVYVVGSDHEEEPRPGSARARCVELGGRSVRVDPGTFSTSQIIAQIKALPDEVTDGQPLQAADDDPRPSGSRPRS